MGSAQLCSKGKQDKADISTLQESGHFYLSLTRYRYGKWASTPLFFGGNLITIQTRFILEEVGFCQPIRLIV